MKGLAAARGARGAAARPLARPGPRVATVCTAARKKINVAYIPRQEEAESLEMLLRDLEATDLGKVSGRADALEKAREVADLAREASRLASAAASLESSMELPSASSSESSVLRDPAPPQRRHTKQAITLFAAPRVSNDPAPTRPFSFRMDMLLVSMPLRKS